MRQGVIWLAAFVLCGLATVGIASAQRRPAPEVLPNETVFYARIPNVKEMMEKMEQTSGGALVQNEQIQALITEFMNLARTEFAPAQERIGLSLDELMSLPQGEACFAVVKTPKDDTFEDPFYVVGFLEVGESADLAKKLIENGEKLAQEDAATIESETEGNIEIKTINNNGEQVSFFSANDTYVFSNNIDGLKRIIARWNIEPTSRDPVFSNNRKFVTIMNRCKGTADERPQIIFFVDPFEIFNQAAQGDVGGQVALGVAKTLGADGFLAIGGSSIFAPEGFDSIGHMHFLLATPREGLVKVLSFKNASTEPAPWVPASVVTYMDATLNVETMFETIGDLYNTVRFEDDGFNTLINERINEPTGLNFQEEIIGNLTGRLTYTAWMEPPARINSQALILGIGLVDGKKAQETIDKLIAKFQNDDLKVEKFEGFTYYKGPTQQERRRLNIERNRRLREQNGEQPTERNGQIDEGDDPSESVNISLRAPNPCIGIVGDTLVFSDSEEGIKAAISTERGRMDRLSSDPEFLSVMDEITRQVGSGKASGILYSRPDNMLKNMMEVANDQKNRKLLEDAAVDNPTLGNINRILRDNPLPAWEDIAQHFRGSGGAMVNDDTGFHFLTFGLKADSAAKK